MIFRLIKKTNLIQNFSLATARTSLKFLISLDEFFWNLRLSTFIFFLGKSSNVGKALYTLKKTGIAVIPDYYSNKKVDEIKKECVSLLDELVENNNSQLTTEKVSNQIKVKGLHTINTFFKNIGRNLKTSIITLAYHVSVSRPFLIYNLFHDGNFKHPVFSDKKKEQSETIAGRPHIDFYLHKLRMCLALEDVKNNNGPTVCYKNSMNLNFIKENHLNQALEDFNFHKNKDISHFVSDDKIKSLEEQSEKYFITAKKGDLILIDLKTVHNQTNLLKGERHLLWFYF